MPGCGKSAHGGARGCCMNHYSCYHNMVKRGKTTWEELESKGLVLKKLSQEEKNKIQSHPHNMNKELL